VGVGAGPTARLLIEYDGTDFSGWARQPEKRTVQAEVERALGIVLRRETVALTVAGRTGSGSVARSKGWSWAEILVT